MESWKTRVPLFRDGYADRMLKKVNALREKAVIYPPQDLIFHAFDRTPFEKVKVVILGQDPYHGKGEAHGLAFSVPDGVPAPPSLRNILKEVAADTGVEKDKTGTDLTSWADQGVLLLNTLLSVEENKALSHKGIGWETLTGQIITELSQQKDHLVFLLWGSKAQSHTALIHQDRHLILSAVHPSPLSAYRGFFGCRHFSKTNTSLVDHGSQPIVW